MTDEERRLAAIKAANEVYAAYARHQRHMTSEAEAEAARAKTAHNETVKLTCTGINSLAVNLFTLGVIAPIVAASFPLPSAPEWGQTSLIAAGVWAGMAYFIHTKARAYMEHTL